MTTFGAGLSAGLLYRELAYTGPQEHYFNDWMLSDFDAHHHSPNPLFVFGSQYIVNQIPDKTSPEGWFEQQTNGNSLSCESPYDCGEEGWYFGGPSESDEQIAGGFFNEINGVDATAWSEKMRLFQKISDNPELFTNGEYSTFMSEINSTEIASLSEFTRSYEIIYSGLSFGKDISVIRNEINSRINQLLVLEATLESSNETESLLIEEQRQPILAELSSFRQTSALLEAASLAHFQSSVSSLLSELAALEVSTSLGATYKDAFSLYLAYVLSENELNEAQLDQLLDLAKRCYRNFGKGAILARTLFDAIAESSTDWSEYDEACKSNERKARIQTDQFNDFSIRPNPVLNQLNLATMEEAQVSTELTIFNGLGEIVYRKLWNGEELVLDSSSWPTGVYVVTWGSADNLLTKKIIKP